MKVAELDWRNVHTLIDPTRDTVSFQLVARFVGESVAVFSYSSTTIDLYDLKGSHLRRLGGEGEGPGEFRFLGGLWAAEEWMWVFDPVLRRVTRFEIGDSASVSTLSFASSSPPYRFVGGLPDGGFVVALLELDRSEVPGPVSDSLLVTLFEAGGIESRVVSGATGFLRYRSSDGSLLSMPFSPKLMAALRDSVVYVGDGSESAMALYDLRGDPSRELVWAGPTRVRVEENYLETVRDRLDSGSRLSQEDALLDAMEGMLMPTYADFVTDDEGRLWLGEYQWEYDNLWAPTTPGGGARRKWVVVSPKGNLLGQLSLPADATVEDVRGNQLLMLREDEYGLQSLALVEVELPGQIREGS